MNIFKKFKTTFNLKNPSKRPKDKEENEVKCLKYRICSEFDIPYVFDTNPRHFHQKPFTPTQSKKLQTKSLSEHNLAFSSFSAESTQDKIDKNEINNKLWPSEGDVRKGDDEERLEPKTNKIEEITPLPKPRKERGILKNKNERYETQNVTVRENELQNEENYSKTNFNEEITYEQYEPIDDQLGEEEIYYFDQNTDDNVHPYVVHKNQTVHFVENASMTSDHEYEVPIDRGTKQDEESEENPVYNLSTHPKLNPTVRGGKDEEFAKSIGLNTFGNTQKLKYPGDYSLEAASIFFDSQNDYEC